MILQGWCFFGKAKCICEMSFAWRRIAICSRNFDLLPSEFCSKFVLNLKEIIIGFRKAFRVTSATQVSASAKTCF